MIATTPRMGTITFMLEDLLKRLEVEYIPPPLTSAKTLALGVRHSPEMACLPLKLTVGNLIEGLEAGADTTIMVGGIGPCRFGYYADLERRVLEGLGYEFTSITLEPPACVGFRRFALSLKRLAPHMSYRSIWHGFKWSFRKGQAFDRVDRAAINTRCYETERGATTRAQQAAYAILDSAWTPDEILEAEREALALVADVPQDPQRDVLRVGIVGEFYLLLEPFTNFDIEVFLGEQGCFLEKGVYLSDWIGPGEENPVGGTPHHTLVETARPYLSHFVGAEGQAVLGHMIMMREMGFDGIVHLMPFTCMPEIIAKSIMPIVSRDHDIPYISLVIDEQSGKAGVHTRLEAFMDLLKARRDKARDAARSGSKAAVEEHALCD